LTQKTGRRTRTLPCRRVGGQTFADFQHTGGRTLTVLPRRQHRFLRWDLPESARRPCGCRWTSRRARRLAPAASAHPSVDEDGALIRTCRSAASQTSHRDNWSVKTMRRRRR
jgi:hypothetical protein